MRHQHEPFEVDPETLGCFNAKLGHPDNSAPRSRCGRRSQKRHEEHRRAIDRIDAALLQAATGQQGSDNGVSGNELRTERAGLHLTDTCLQLSDAFCRRQVAAHCTRNPTTTAVAAATALSRKDFSGR